MSLRRVLAAGFKHHGRGRLTETELVSALALDRGWYTPDEVRELIELGVDRGELIADGDVLVPTFEVGEVTIPSGYEPPEGLLDVVPPFERLLGELETEGYDRRESVAGINELQARSHLTSDAAAVIYAHRQGLDISTVATEVRRDLEGQVERA